MRATCRSVGWAPAGFAALQAEDCAGLATYDPEIVLLGTGATQRFAHFLVPVLQVPMTHAPA